MSGSVFSCDVCSYHPLIPKVYGWIFDIPIFSAFHLYFSSSIDHVAARGGFTWPRAPAAGYITATRPLQCCSAAELQSWTARPQIWQPCSTILRPLYQKDFLSIFAGGWCSTGGGYQLKSRGLQWLSNTGDRFAAGYKHVALQLIGRPACSLQPAVLQWPLVSAIIVVTGSANIAHPPYLHNLTIYLSIYHCWLNSREKLDRLHTI